MPSTAALFTWLACLPDKVALVALPWQPAQVRVPPQVGGTKVPWPLLWQLRLEHWLVAKLPPPANFTSMERWLARQKTRLLHCDYYHVIFTLPHELNPLWLSAVGAMTKLLFGAIRDTLFELLGAPKYLGAEPGLIVGLHTWGQTASLHPHGHCLVTGGGMTPGGLWRASRNGYLLPGRVARDLFRGKMLAALRSELASGRLAVPAGERPWMRRGTPLSFLSSLTT